MKFKLMAILMLTCTSCIVDSLPSNNPPQSPYSFPTEAPIWQHHYYQNGKEVAPKKVRRMEGLKDYIGRNTSYGKIPNR